MHFRAKSLPVLLCFTRKTSEKAPLQRGGEVVFQGLLRTGRILTERKRKQQENTKG